MIKIASKCLVFFVVAIGSLQAGSMCYATQVTLKFGTPVRVKLTEPISESPNASHIVSLVVSAPVYVGLSQVIKSGSKVLGEVEGGVILVIKETTAVDGTKVPLRGGATMVPVGTELRAYVEHDTLINAPQ